MKPGTRERIDVGNVVAEVTYKATRRLYLRVNSASDPVLVSAPWRLSRKAVSAFIRNQVIWIERQREKHRRLESLPVPTYDDGETLMLWGRLYTIVRIDRDPPAVELGEGCVRLCVPTGAAPEVCESVLGAWYTSMMSDVLVPLVARWAFRLGLNTPKIKIRKLKSRWGSCSTRSKSVTFNVELARRPPACLEYIVVHELVHFIVGPHNTRFYAILDHYLPQWGDVRRELNALSIGQ